MHVRTPEQRFWRYVHKRDPDECWPWIGRSWVGKPGGIRYGKFWFREKSQSANRVSYMLHTGEIPAGLFVRHTCDNGPCVNPAHLVTGTQADNMRDCSERGRTIIGSANLSSRLTEEKVVKIIQGLRAGLSQGRLSNDFSVARTTIRRIERGETWKHVPRVLLEEALK